MDLVFSSILLFILFLPGITFRFFYYSYPFSRGAIENKIITEIAYSIPLSILLHFVAIKFVENISNHRISFEVIGTLLISDDKDVVKTNFNNIEQNLVPVFIYNFSLSALGALLGRCSQKVIRWFKWDKRFRLFRFPNRWYYILTGEILDFPRSDNSSGKNGNSREENNGSNDLSPHSHKEIEMITVDLLCKIDDKCYIYNGQVYEYYLNDSRGLDTILLRYPRRKEFNNKEEDFYNILSRFIYIPFSSVINTNVRYLSLKEVEKADQESAEELRAMEKAAKELQVVESKTTGNTEFPNQDNPFL